MEKHLVRVGNSLGLVIERSICKLLHMTVETPLSITTDGRRIVIEPLDAPAILPAEQLDVVPLIYEISDRMPEHLHQRIHPGIPAMRAGIKARVWADKVRDDPRPGDELFVRRYRICLEAWQDGASWEEAAARAVAAVHVPAGVRGVAGEIWRVPPAAPTNVSEAPTASTNATEGNEATAAGGELSCG